MNVIGKTSDLKIFKKKNFVNDRKKFKFSYFVKKFLHTLTKEKTFKLLIIYRLITYSF